MSNPPVTPTLQATASRLREQYQGSDFQAIRHLSAGVYVDRSFRDLVIRKARNNFPRRAAPSRGFDPVPVMRHAWRRSRYLDRGLQVAIVGSLVLDSRLAVTRVVMCDPRLFDASRDSTDYGRNVPGAGCCTENWFKRHKFRIRPEAPGSPDYSSTEFSLLHPTSA